MVIANQFHLSLIQVKERNIHEGIKKFFFILLCIIAVYFIGDKLALWPAGVREVVNRSFENMQAMFKKDENGAARSEASVGKNEKDKYSDNTITDNNTVEEKEFTEEEIVAAWDEIYARLMKMGQENDVEGMKQYLGTTEEDAVSKCQAYKDRAYNNYDSKNSYIIANYENYYCLETVEYMVTGYDPNTKMSSSSTYLWIIYDDGEWRPIVDSDIPVEEEKKVSEESASIMLDKYGAGFKDACNAGRNAVNFGNWMFTHPEMTYNGCFNNDIIAAWQNEDGSVDLQLWSANGLSEIKTLTDVQITLTDDTLGTICDVTLDNYLEGVTPGRSEVFTIHVEPSKVRTGTSTWGSLHTNSSVHYR